MTTIRFLTLSTFFALGAPYLVQAQAIGNCTAGIASGDLDINNIRARLYNTGVNFYNRGVGTFYEVPKETRINAIYSQGLWVGGKVDGELRVTGSDFGPWEYWPGPLSDKGQPPADCSEFDRMYRVSRDDILEYQRSGYATADMLDWPHHLGAPILHSDDDPSTYDLGGGDMPLLYGDQAVWWVMNDAGNFHSRFGTTPIGIEVRGHAFAFEWIGLENITFYRYEIENKSDKDLKEAWVGVFTDVDLGDAHDDYVGCDTARGLGFVYNGDDFDWSGYDNRPAALGIDFLAGPVRDEQGNNLGATTCLGYAKHGQGDPETAQDAYNYMQAIWRDGAPLTRGRVGPRTTYRYDGDPPSYWSEEDTDGAGSRNNPGDRRLVMAAGPFDLEAGASTTLIYGIIFGRGSDRYESIRQVKSLSALAGAPIEVDTPWRRSDFIDAPRVSTKARDGSVEIEWGYKKSDNNFGDGYDWANPFLEGREIADATYTFEGYNVYRYTHLGDADGQLIATYDVVNGITTVVDIVDATTTVPQTEVSAYGTDSGVRHEIAIDGLNNHTTYYFGVEAYAYNEFSFPRVMKSDVSRVVVQPSIPQPTLDQVAVVPNPYKGASDYEISNWKDVVRITNLPDDAEIRIFDLNGTLIRRLNKRGPSNSIDWDLRTEGDLPIGSGMYLIHVKARGVGETVVKFGVARKKTFFNGQ